ncbi:MAG TPA: AMP-dependent synthetase/ligase [Solirubrobacteraceae bacterium]|nr:AMP-dependent synthetase/ligase [Solirubrobacteraceae bacterium]
MSTAASRATTAETLAAAFRITAADHADRVAVRTKDDEMSLTWGGLRERVDALAGGLHDLGVRRGDTVALMMGNRPEFHIADLAVMTLGATPFSIYQTFSPEQIAYVVEDSGTRVALIEAQYADAFPDLEHVLVLEDGWPERADFDAEPHWRAVEPDDVATLIYTSGTTGPPKGVQLQHRNLAAATRSTEQLIQFPDGAKVISWLPAAHIAERMAHHYLPIVYAMTITSCPNPREVVGYLPAVKPTWFFAVPRIWEKLKAGMEAFLLQGENASRNQAWLAGAARKVELEQAGEEVPADLVRSVEEADRELFAGLRAMLGLDEAVSVNVGAAPTPREVLVFFHAIGIPLAELWGMSETCGAGACNPPGQVKIGTVGPAGPGVEVRLADDGELLVRSDVVMPGYRNAPDKTSEAIDGDGWLHTGDIAEIDEDGYIRIVDRKKEIIINAAGKNMSPANIESTLKGASPLIGQACVIGDGRPYNTALIVLDADFAPAWASQNGISTTDLAELARDERMRAAVQAGVDAANAKLARVEQIKKFTLVQGDWAPGGDEITPTMKLKRKPIAAKYEPEIEAMYG